jgi:hypothetical protein
VSQKQKRSVLTTFLTIVDEGREANATITKSEKYYEIIVYLTLLYYFKAMLYANI